jgi:hypothetical protein
MISHKVFSKSIGELKISVADHEIDALRGKLRIGFCVSVISGMGTLLTLQATTTEFPCVQFPNFITLDGHPI